jgi:hypothetical protein
MAELRAAVTSLGHADVMTYVQSGNVLLTPGRASRMTAGRPDTAALAAELERAIADGIGVRARAVVLSREELARCVHDNPYPGEMNPQAAARGVPPRGPRTRPGRLGGRRRAASAGARQQGRGPGARPHGVPAYAGRVPAQRPAPGARQGGRADLGRSGRDSAQLGHGHQTGRPLRTTGGRVLSRQQARTAGRRRKRRANMSQMPTDVPGRNARPVSSRPPRRCRCRSRRGASRRPGPPAGRPGPRPPVRACRAGP